MEFVQVNVAIYHFDKKKKTQNIWEMNNGYCPSFYSVENMNYFLHKQLPSEAKHVFFLSHLSHSGDLLLWVGVRRRASCVVRRASCVVLLLKNDWANLNQVWHVVSVG